MRITMNTRLCFENGASEAFLKLKFGVRNFLLVMWDQSCIKFFLDFFFFFFFFKIGLGAGVNGMFYASQS